MSIKQAHTHSTTRDPSTGRVKVEHGETAQTTGTEFQTAQFSTAALAPQVMEIVAPEPIDITEMEMTVNLGGVNVSIFEASDGTAGGTFTPLEVTSTNRRVPKTPSFSVGTGGTFAPTGNPMRPPLSVNTASSGNNVLSNTRRNTKRFSLAAGTYYVVVGLLVGVTSFTGNLVLTISEALDS
jgi:hypothetical protein